MKRKVILALLLAVGVTTFGSSGLSVYADDISSLNLQQEVINESRSVTEDTFEKIVKTRGLEGCSAKMGTSLKTSDNSILLLYVINSNFYLEKLDKNLSTIWVKTYNLGEANTGANFTIVEDKNGDILFGSSTMNVGSVLDTFKKSSYTPESPKTTLFVARCNSEGDLIDGRMLAVDDTSVNYGMKALIPMENGNWGVAMKGGYGKTMNCEGYEIGESGGILVLDSDFNVLSKTSSTFDGSYSTWLKKKDGTVILATGGTNNYIYIYNSDLEITSTKKCNYGYYITLMQEKENGDVVLFCNGDSSSTDDSTYILTVDSSANVKDVKKVGRYLMVRSVLGKEDGGYYLYGQKGGSTMVLETDSTFNLLDQISLTPAYSTYVSSGEVIGSSVYLFTHSSSKSLGVDLIGKSDIIATKLTDKDMIKPEAPTVSKLEDGKLQLIDNSGLGDTKIYYKYITEETVILEDGWLEYTEAFVPKYNKDGSLKIQVKIVSESKGEGEIGEFTDFNSDYVDTETDKNIDVMFTLDDTLSFSMSLGKNTVDFGSVSGLTEKESTEDVVVTVSSSKPWDLSIKALTDFIGQTDSNNIVDASKLSAKANEEDYKSLIKNTEVPLLENQSAGSDIQTSLKFKLSEVTGSKADTYKMTTRVKVTQK